MLFSRLIYYCYYYCCCRLPHHFNSDISITSTYISDTYTFLLVSSTPQFPERLLPTQRACQSVSYFLVGSVKCLKRAVRHACASCIEAKKCGPLLPPFALYTAVLMRTMSADPQISWAGRSALPKQTRSPWRGCNFWAGWRKKECVWMTPVRLPIETAVVPTKARGVGFRRNIEINHDLFLPILFMSIRRWSDCHGVDALTAYCCEVWGSHEDDWRLLSSGICKR
jgi:hypothetical protein